MSRWLKFHTPPRTPGPRRVRSPLFDVIALFMRLGTTAFGGPAAAIAMMRDETVTRRRWLDDARFLDLLGTTNLTPGPAASKMAMYLGYVRAGLAGSVAGGLSYLFPTASLMLALAWAYARYHTTPAAAWLLYGIKPVVIPIIALALWSLGRRAITDRLTGLIALGALLLYGAGTHPLLILLGGAVSVLVVRAAPHARHLTLPLGLLLTAGAPPASVGLLPIFGVFLKIGALLYGSGYVLLAFFQADLVDGRGWISQQVLLDAIALGQIMPGPLSTSATFIGYLLAGVPGALAATAGIYLPAFVIVALSGPLIPRLRRWAWTANLLDGVNAAAVGLMTGVTLQLAQTAFSDAYTLLIAGLAAMLMWRWRVNSALLVITGALLGLLSSAW